MVVPWSVSRTEPTTKSVQYMGGGDAGDIIFDYGTMLASPGVIGYALHIIGICVAVASGWRKLLDRVLHINRTSRRLYNGDYYHS